MTKFSAYFLSLLLLISTSLFAQNVGIGTTTPVNKLSVNGKMDVTDSMGIGTNTPAAALHLQSANVSDTSRGDIILSRYWNGNTDTRASSIFHYNNTGTNSDNLAFGVAGNGGSFLRPNALSQIKMLIQANGNVGIGTTIPANKLSVVGKMDITESLGIGTTTPAGEFHVKSADFSGSIDQQQTSSNTLSNNMVSWQSFTASVTGFLMRVDLFVSSVSGPQAGTIRIFNGEGNGGTVLSSTQVTFAPNYNFITYVLSSTPQLIAGNKYTIEFSGSSSTLIIYSDNRNPYSGGKTNNANANIDYYFRTYMTTSLIKDALVVTDTKVGIGTHTPTAKLDIAGTTKTTNLQITNGASNEFILKSDAAGNASWATNNYIETDPKVGTLGNNKIPKWNGIALADGLLFDNGANVGIGTTTPAQKLDVAGTTKTTNLQITNGASNGFILRSDAAGNASWVSNNYTETDPKVGTLTTNKIPKWNGTTLADGILLDNGVNVGIGTNSPSDKLTVISGNTSQFTSIGIGRTSVEGTMSIAAAPGQFAQDAVAGDLVLRTQSIANKVILNNAAGNAALTVTNGSVGIGTTSPAGDLHVKSIVSTNSVLDQEQRIFGVVMNGGTIKWQSFTAGATGSLVRVDLGVGSSNSPSTSQGTIKIFSGVGNSGPLLSTTNVTFQDVIFTVQSFALSYAPPVVAGNVYTIEFSVSTGTVNWAHINPDNEYLGGRADFSLFNDYTFRTFVSTQTTDGLVVVDGKVGVNTTTPAIELDVNGGIRTKYSGSNVVNLGVGTHTVNINMPNAVPASWNNSNTIAMVINGDGAEGFVRAAKITSTTNLQVRFQQDQGGFVRLNWVILKL